MLPVLAPSSNLPAGDPGNATRDASSGSSASAFMPCIPHGISYSVIQINLASCNGGRLQMPQVHHWVAGYTLHVLD